ncbi:helix-turn-helix transcriptional regulator [Corynebacterium provencense]|uniref:helix-turn-helix transcriptional regulator n=1 Tax=Corynebacterium provencense TaxID=1737425 RepID=UPI00098F2CD2|nr:helix-turn-helix transcriptional regulator [Corynebacterium provencense]
MATPDPNREELGRFIRERRERAGMTQSELAKLMTKRLGNSIYQTTIGRIENGERSLSLTEATVIADALNVPIHDLSYRASPTTPETLRQNYIIRITEAVNSLVMAESALKSLSNTADNLIDLPEDQRTALPDGLQKRISNLSADAFIYDDLRNSIKESIQILNDDFHKWLGSVDQDSTDD